MFFLAFEGLDGSGKSSLMGRLKSHLTDLHISYIQTREPGGTVVGDQLREIILRRSEEVPVPRTELLLYEASRAQHVELVIKPALEQKAWVLCDRFTASSIAFQAGGRSISEQQVLWLNNFATGSLSPDLNVLLDLSVEESQKRRQQRSFQDGTSEDRMESEAKSFHERVRAAFLKQAMDDPKHWLVLDASLTPESLFESLLAELRERQWLA